MLTLLFSDELAHQWFGNLVTMDWWDELWLNESFATWAGWYAVNEFHPEWQVWAQFVVSFYPINNISSYSSFGSAEMVRPAPP